MFDFLELNKPMSADSNTDPDDVLKTKDALNKTGHYEIPSYGMTDMPDQKMIDGIKTFQKDNGLKVDGIMKPKGPTKKKLGEKVNSVEPRKPIQVIPAPLKPTPVKKPPKIDWNDLTEEVTTPIRGPLPIEERVKNPIVISKPEGETTQKRLQSLMMGPR